jgi:hypothetical protein
MENVIFSEHAGTQMARRGITESLVREVLFRQEEIIDLRPGRIVIQGTTRMGNPPGDYLLRVFVDTDCEPPEVVTVYRTSKIDKYRSRT